MSKKLLALSLGIIMVLSLMAGCGGNNGGKIGRASCRERV